MRGYRMEPVESARRLSADALVAAAAASRADLTPTTLVIRSDRSAPASLAAGAGRQVFVDPYSGDVLGRRQRTVGAECLPCHHRVASVCGRVWRTRPLGRTITGASNLMFLFIVVSGLFLWWPRAWTWAAVRSVVWFRRGLPGKARDFNWHNTIGFWSAIPLAAIVAGGVVISYPWATALVYRVYQEEPPAAGGALAARGGVPGVRAAASGGGLEDEVSARLSKLLSRERKRRCPNGEASAVALPARDAQRVTLTLDAGDGGQPHKRATLTLDRQTGDVVRWEPYSSQSPGRRARTWLRFAHTGEVYGMAGQTLAGVVTSGGAVLVWTGIALALRRFTAWRGHRA